MFGSIFANASTNDFKFVAKITTSLSWFAVYSFFKSLITSITQRYINTIIYVNNFNIICLCKYIRLYLYYKINRLCVQQ